MNIYALIATILAFLANVAHLTVGKNDYLAPILNSNIDTIPKNIVLALFHYTTIILGVTTVALALVSFGNVSAHAANAMLIFIAAVYYGFTLVQLAIGYTSGIKNGIFKMFQWTLWILIAVLSTLTLLKL